MTDRELLELAAKAAWYEPEAYRESQNYLVVHNGETGGNRFAPLTDDGDALRLAVNLEIRVEQSFGMDSGPCCNVLIPQDIGKVTRTHCVSHGDDPYAATRRAIGKAAAKIGRGMG